MKTTGLDYYISKLQCHWPMIWLGYLLLLNCFYANYWIVCPFFIAVIIRIYYCGRDVLRYCIVIWSVLVMFFGVHAMYAQHVSNMSFSDQEASYHVLIYPNSGKLRDNTWQGPVSVYSTDQKQWIRAQAYYSLPGNSVETNTVQSTLFESDWPIQLNVSGKITKPTRAMNFDVFDYQHYLKSKNIAWSLSIKHVTASKEVVHWRYIGMYMRAKILNPIARLKSNLILDIQKKLIFNQDSVGYDQVRKSLSQLGVVHFFAISGLHLYYLFNGLHYLLRLCRCPLRYIDVVAIVILSGYSWIVGFPIGAVRVISMLLLTKVIRLYRLNCSKLDCLSLVGLMILFVAPNQGWQLSYQLSFVMTFIVHIMQQTTFSTRILNDIVTTMTCLLFSWPLLLMHYHEFRILQIVWIIVFAYLFDKILWPFFVTLTLMLYIMPNTAQRLTDYIASHLKWNTLDDITPLFDASWNIPTMPFVMLFLLYVFAILSIKYSRDLSTGTQKQRSLTRLGIVYGCYFALIVSAPFLNFSTKLTVLYVGQGDSLIMQSPLSTEVSMIDTGGEMKLLETSQHPNKFDDTQYNINDEFAYRNLIPALKAKGINGINTLIITHPDIDHMGNLKTLIKHFAIRRVVISPETYQSPEFQKISDSFNPKTKIDVLNYGQVSQVNSEMTVFLLKDQAMAKQSNDTSIMTLIKIGNKTLLNLGDNSQKIEQKLVREYPHLLVDILKLAHHGSKHSSSVALLNAYHPKLALISVGRHNRYGHPHNEVLLRLEQAGISYLSTDEYGAIEIRKNLINQYSLETARD